MMRKLLYPLPLFLAPLSAFAEDPPRPNILFIAVDDLNDYVGCLGGHPDAITPNIDSLAQQGMLFTNAHVPAPVCNPSRAAFLSGIAPHNSGIYHNGNSFDGLGVDYLPLHFRKQGYYTMWVGKIPHTENHFNNLDEALDERGSRGAAGLGTISDDFPSPSPWDGLYGVHNYAVHWGGLEGTKGLSDFETADWAVERLGNNYEKPFMLMVGFHRPHTPLTSPTEYWNMFDPEQLTLPPREEDDLHDMPWLGRQVALAGWQEMQGGHYRNITESGHHRDILRGYLAASTFVDAQIGRVLDALEASPHADNTIVVLFSDHGWGIGERSHFKKWGLWDDTTRVPFIAKVPGMTQAGSSSDAGVTLQDLFPTLVDLAGIDPPAHDLDGDSIRPLLEDPAATWERPALTTYGEGNHTVRSPRWRYIRWSNGSEELYDHQSDPNETQNLAEDPAYDSVKADLAQWLPTNDLPPQDGVQLSFPRGAGARLHRSVNPGFAGEPLHVSARIGPNISDGVIIQHGGVACAYALHVADGKLAFTLMDVPDDFDWDDLDPTRTTVLSDDPLPTGSEIEVEAHLAKDGSVVLTVDDVPVGGGLAKTLAMDVAGELRVGKASKNYPPAGDYEPPNEFDGDLISVNVNTGVYTPPFPGLLVQDQIAPLGQVEDPYSATLSALGGAEPYSWQHTGGSMPPGLSLNPDTGALAGTPSAAGRYTFTVEVTDATSGTNAGEVSLDVISTTSDIDGNGLTDQWEIDNFGSIGQDPTGNPDVDGADNLAEQNAGSDPNQAHSDSDGIIDGVEIGLGRDPSALDRASLTYTDNFEDRVGLLSSNPGMWSIVAGTTMEIKESVGESSTRGLEISSADDEVKQYINQSAVSVLWHDFYTQMSVSPVDGEPENLSTDSAVVFLLNENGDIRALDGSSWTNYSADLDTATFHRYTVEMDYTAQTYNLYVDGDTTAVASGVAFANTVSVPNYLKIVQGDSVGAVIDNVYISTTPPAGFGGSTPTTTYADWEAAQTWPTGADQTPSGDSDGDTITNLMEYGLDLDVSTNDYNKLPEGGYLDDGTDQWATLTYRRNTTQGDLTYTIQKSSGLSTWTDLTIDGTNVVETVTNSDVDGDGSAELVEVKVKLSSPDETVFLRLQVDDGSTFVMTNPVNGNGFGIPSTEDFDAYTLYTTLNGNGGWFLHAGTDPAVKEAINANFGQVAEITGDTTDVSAYYRSSGAATTWVDMSLVPVVYGTSVPALDTDTSLGMYFDSDGYLNVNNGSTWTALNSVNAVDTNTWQRLTAKLDYSSNLADVWLNGVSVATGLSFLDNRSQFSSVRLRQESTQAAYLDNLKVQDTAIEAILPYAETFEDAAVSALWSGETGTISASTEQAQEGTQSLKINGTARAEFGGVGLGEIWVDLHVYADGSASVPSINADTIVGVYFDTNGKVFVSDGATWADTGATVTLNDWQRITVKMNYTTDSFDVYVNTTPSGTGYTFAATPDAESMQAIEVEASNQYIDNVQVAASSTL